MPRTDETRDRRSETVTMPNGVTCTGYSNYEPDFKSDAHYLVWSYSHWGKKIVRSFKCLILEEWRGLTSRSR